MPKFNDFELDLQKIEVKKEADNVAYGRESFTNCFCPPSYKTMCDCL